MLGFVKFERGKCIAPRRTRAFSRISRKDMCAAAPSANNKSGKAFRRAEQKELGYKRQEKHGKFSLARAQAPAQMSSQVFRPFMAHPHNTSSLAQLSPAPPTPFKWCQAGTARRHFHDYKQRTRTPEQKQQQRGTLKWKLLTDSKKRISM